MATFDVSIFISNIFICLELLFVARSYINLANILTFFKKFTMFVSKLMDGPIPNKYMPIVNR